MALLGHNFKLMAAAGAMIVIGFLLMAGGATGWEEFNPDIFSTPVSYKHLRAHE
ncbi:MAG: DUF3098 domain-containing protein, partial [Duncaniella sp.]|nr:DUF3098 domain-containing protein [Duncaniella sp.]